MKGTEKNIYRNVAQNASLRPLIASFLSLGKSPKTSSVNSTNASQDAPVGDGECASSSAPTGDDGEGALNGADTTLMMTMITQLEIWTVNLFWQVRIRLTDDMEESVSASFEKCCGFVVPLVNRDDINSNFPFTDLPQLSVVFENCYFHVLECAENGYRLCQSTPEMLNVNKQCYNLQYSHSLLKVLENMECDSYHKTHAVHSKLSHKQIVQRVQNYSNLYQQQRMSTFNLAKKYDWLNKTLELDQRFLLLIKENNVRRLHDVVKVVLNAKRSIGYIVTKVMDAIDGIYTPQYSQDDKDIAFLILQFGGPGLLDIAHRAFSLPSVSTAYNMIKGLLCIKSSAMETLG